MRTENSGFLTVVEAAQLAGLSHWTIRLWLQKGLLKKYKSASRTVVSRAELLELVKPKPVMAGGGQ
jgi:excisionase family DNA binding protein